MGVRFQIFGGGDSLATNFSVSYASNGNVDPKVFTIRRGQGNPSTTDFINIDIATNDRMRFGRQGGTGNVVSNTSILATTLMNSKLQGVQQFAQAKLMAAVPALAETGPAVFLCGDQALDEGVTDGGNGYAMLANGTTGTWLLRRASITETALLNTGVLFAVNDVARIEVRILPNTDRQIKLIVNSVTIATVTDAAAATRPPDGAGFPGMFVGNVPVPNGTIGGAWGAQSFGLV